MSSPSALVAQEHALHISAAEPAVATIPALPQHFRMKQLFSAKSHNPHFYCHAAGTSS
jgi:hypothetical protein